MSLIEILKGMPNAHEPINENFKKVEYSRITNEFGTSIKYADGTLIQYGDVILEFADNSALSKNWNFPTPFANTFYVVIWNAKTHLAGKNNFHHEYSNAHVNRSQLVARANPNQFANGDKIEAGAIAFGRWK